MKKSILFSYTITFLLLLTFFFGCATSGRQFISIHYLAGHDKQHTGTIGISPFKDNRQGMDKGYIGYRLLLDNSQQTYMVQGLDLARALEKAVMTYYEKNGLNTAVIEPWAPTPEGLQEAAGDFTQILAGTIQKFECRARKKAGITQMTLDIDITLYLGMEDKRTLKTIPISFTLNRTDAPFNQYKLENFINESLEELIRKALVLN